MKIQEFERSGIGLIAEIRVIPNRFPNQDTGGNYGLPFGAHRGVTQGGPLSSLMFNVCINCVVREWLRQVLDVVVACFRMGESVCNQCIAFFVDDGLVTARCPEWL
jgi:hypothetical protein